MTHQVYARSSNGTPLFRKECEMCGRVSVVDRRKLGKPCHGCAMRQRSTHGLASRGKLHPLYRLWSAIRTRCSEANAHKYPYYSGRGIRVCKEWDDNVQEFVAWALRNGWAPGLEIDRIDVDGNYEPSNCRFVTHRVNSQNRRTTPTTVDQARKVKQHLLLGGSVKSAAQVAGVTYMVAWHIKNGQGVWENA